MVRAGGKIYRHNLKGVDEGGKFDAFVKTPF
jgi:hypothetical protein